LGCSCPVNQPTLIHRSRIVAPTIAQPSSISESLLVQPTEALFHNTWRFYNKLVVLPNPLALLPAAASPQVKEEPPGGQSLAMGVRDRMLNLKAALGCGWEYIDPLNSTETSFRVGKNASMPTGRTICFSASPSLFLFSLPVLEYLCRTCDLLSQARHCLSRGRTHRRGHWPSAGPATSTLKR